MTDTKLSRKDRKAATAQAVLDAARHLFTTHGYEATTMRSIAQQVGMSTGAIFASYPDKAALFSAAMGHPPVTQELGWLAVQALLMLEEGSRRFTRHPGDVGEVARAVVALATDLRQQLGMTPAEREAA